MKKEEVRKDADSGLEYVRRYILLCVNVFQIFFNFSALIEYNAKNVDVMCKWIFVELLLNVIRIKYLCTCVCVSYKYVEIPSSIICLRISITTPALSRWCCWSPSSSKFLCNDPQNTATVIKYIWKKKKKKNIHTFTFQMFV